MFTVIKNAIYYYYDYYERYFAIMIIDEGENH